MPVSRCARVGLGRVGPACEVVTGADPADSVKLGAESFLIVPEKQQLTTGLGSLQELQEPVG